MFMAKTAMTALLAVFLQAPSIAAAQGVPSPTHGPVAVDSFQVFKRPHIIRALHLNDMPSLRSDKVGTFIYLMQVIEALEAPDVWYRIGQDMEAKLDPRLAPTARGLAMTERDILDAFIRPGAGMFIEVLKGLADERRRQVASGTFDPTAEITAVNRGLLRGGSPFAVLKADAGFDARRLMLLARDNPEGFLRIYEAVRTFIYSY